MEVFRFCAGEFCKLKFDVGLLEALCMSKYLSPLQVIERLGQANESLTCWADSIEELKCSHMAAGKGEEI